MFVREPPPAERIAAQAEDEHRVASRFGLSGGTLFMRRRASAPFGRTGRLMPSVTVSRRRRSAPWGIGAAGSRA